MARNWYPDSVPRALLVVLTVAIGAAVLFGGLTSGTVFGSYNPSWDGSTELRDIGTGTDGDTRIVRETSAYDVPDPSATVSFVLSPDSGYSEAEADRVEQFVRAGGTLVVAEDVGPHSDALLADISADARFDGARLRDERFYETSPTMPIATNPTNDRYTERVSALALNYGTAVRPGGARILVNTSSYAYLDRNDNGVLDARDSLREYPVVTRERVGNGTVVAIGDPSVFINAMIDRRDNRRFARNIVAAHRLRLLDVSHLAALPPLVSARFLLQESTVAQATAGLGLVLAVSYASVLGRVRRRFGGGSESDSTDDRDSLVDESSVVDWVSARRPDWDRERVWRVSEGISRQKRNRERDD
jgi:hypothetical protein